MRDGLTPAVKLKLRRQHRNSRRGGQLRRRCCDGERPRRPARPACAAHGVLTGTRIAESDDGEMNADDNERSERLMPDVEAMPSCSTDRRRT